MVESPASFDWVTCLPPKNASAPGGGPGSRRLTIIVWQVSYVQYLLACQKSQRSTPYNIVKSGLPWKRVFRRRHLGRRVTAVTCLRWPTVNMQYPSIAFDDEYNVLSLIPFCLNTLVRESCLRQSFLTQLRAYFYQLCLPDSAAAPTGSIFVRPTKHLPTPRLPQPPPRPRHPIKRS